jgi:hypothetical protein
MDDYGVRERGMEASKAAGCGMERICSRTPNLMIRVLVGLFLSSAAPDVSSAQALTIGDSFQLIPGIVVDRARNQAYVMGPEGGVLAIDLAQGNQLWQSKEATKPLTLAGNLLVSQAEPKASPNELRIVTLDTAEAGRVVSATAQPLPAGVKAATVTTRTSEFTANAAAVGNNAAVSWQFVERPMQGIPPRQREVLPGEKRPDQSAAAPATPKSASPTSFQGIFGMELTSGKVISAVPAPAVAAAAAPVRHPFAVEARVADIPEPQFLSADGRHILHSERQADDSVWDKYLWSIYDHNTRERMGQFKTHVSFAPFFVADTKVIYETGPYARRAAAGVIQEPEQIRAVDLRTGEQVWSQPIRDTTPRGPVPR